MRCFVFWVKIINVYNCFSKINERTSQIIISGTSNRQYKRVVISQFYLSKLYWFSCQCRDKGPKKTFLYDYLSFAEN